MALSTTGTTLLGGLPSASDLNSMRVAEQSSEGRAGAPGLDDCLDKQTGGDKGLLELAASAKKPQFFSAAQGLPTIPPNLAQRIWDLEFVEMADFLPSNKAVQALEQQSTSQVVQDGVLGALQQFQQQQQQGQRVTDTTAWTRCLTLYIAVMASRRAVLVPAMVAHLHAVLKVPRSGGWHSYSLTGGRGGRCALREPQRGSSRIHNNSSPSLQGKAQRHRIRLRCHHKFSYQLASPRSSQQTPGAGPATKPPGVSPQPYRLPPKPKKSGVCCLFKIVPMA